MSRNYFNLSELAAAASACDCSAHLHLDAQGQTVYSIGSEELGAVEFDTYTAALKWATNRSAHNEADCAEQAGHAIATDCLNAILNAHDQGERMNVLVAALLGLQRLQHPERAAGGFAVALVNVIEIGLRNLPKVEGADHV